MWHTFANTVCYISQCMLKMCHMLSAAYWKWATWYPKKNKLMYFILKIKNIHNICGKKHYSNYLTLPKETFFDEKISTKQEGTKQMNIDRKLHLLVTVATTVFVNFFSEVCFQRYYQWQMFLFYPQGMLLRCFHF